MSTNQNQDESRTGCCRFATSLQCILNYFKTCRHPKSFKSCQINMQILPAQHLLRPTAASLQELRNQCLTSKHIKTYQNISKHIKTQHLQSAASTNSPRSARIEQHHFACRVNGVRNQTDRICAFDCFCSCLFFFWSQKNCGRIRFILQALSKSCPPCLAFQTESNRSRALLLIVLLASRF